MDDGRAGPAVREVAEEVEARCLDGMVRAADLLAGEEPERVCAVFSLWLAEARRTWPWLPGLCYDALEALGVAFPSKDRRAVVLGRLLVAAETDAAAVQAARRALEPATRARREPGLGNAAGTLRVRRLMAAVDRFWSELGRGTAELNEVVLVHDRAGADRILGRTRRRLEDVAEEIAWLAGAVADAGRAAPPAPTPVVPPEPGPPPAPDPPPVQAPPPPPVTVRLPRTAGQRQQSPPARPRPASRAVRRPLPPPERGPRDRTWEPIVFLILALAAAVLVLVRVGSI